MQKYRFFISCIKNFYTNRKPPLRKATMAQNQVGAASGALRALYI